MKSHRHIHSNFMTVNDLFAMKALLNAGQLNLELPVGYD